MLDSLFSSGLIFGKLFHSFGTVWRFQAFIFGKILYFIFILFFISGKCHIFLMKISNVVITSDVLLILNTKLPCYDLCRPGKICFWRARLLNTCDSTKYKLSHRCLMIICRNFPNKYSWEPQRVDTFDRILLRIH